MSTAATRPGLEPLANLNGKQMPLADVLVPALDRGFLFGDAVYEVIRVYDGKPFLAEEHWRRFARSLEEVRIRGVDLDRLKRVMTETIAAWPFREATVYIQITRGVAPRLHGFPKDVPPTELLWVAEFNDPYAEPRRNGGNVNTHPDVRWGRCDIKSTNLLANVLAAQAGKEADCVETLLYAPDGTLTEATHSSLFGVLDGTLRTAPNGPEILPGITRDLVIRTANRLDIPFRETALNRADLPAVSELFLSGTTSEVLPLVRVDGTPVADGKPGPITRRLQEAYRQSVRELIG